MTTNPTMPTRDINELLPEARGACTLHLAVCKQRGINIFVTQTYRTAAYQNKLFTVDKTTPLDGYKYISEHQKRLAWDIACYGGDLYDKDILAKAGAVARELGITWGGDFKKVDMPHFEIKKGQIITFKGGREVEKEITLQLNGVLKKVNAIEKDGNNFVKLQDIRDHWIKIDFDSINKIPIIETRS